MIYIVLSLPFLFFGLFTRTYDLYGTCFFVDVISWGPVCYAQGSWLPFLLVQGSFVIGAGLIGVGLVQIRKRRDASKNQ